jgi:hypothetical protein
MGRVGCVRVDRAAYRITRDELAGPSDAGFVGRTKATKCKKKKKNEITYLIYLIAISNVLLLIYFKVLQTAGKGGYRNTTQRVHVHSTAKAKMYL